MNEKLNIQDLIEWLAEKHGMSKKNAETFVKEFFSLIEESLESDKYVRIKGLGTFKLIEVESRESVKVNTGERFEIEGHTKVSFTPEPALKDAINQPFAHFEPVPLNDGFDADAVPESAESSETSESTESTETSVPTASSVQPAIVVGGEPVQAAAAADGEKTATEAEASHSDSPTEAPVEETAETPENNREEAAVAAEENTSAVTEDTEETETLSSESDDSEEEDPDGKSSRWLKAGIAAGIVILLLCLSAIVYVYYPDLFRQEQPEKETAEVLTAGTTDTLTSGELLLRADSLPTVSRDSTQPAARPSSASTVVPSLQKETAVQQKPVSVPSAAAVAFAPDSTGYVITGTQATYTIQSGETLTRVALRFYGTKALYPYIVKHNQGVITNPDNVPAGTKIRIPKLEKK